MPPLNKKVFTKKTEDIATPSNSNKPKPQITKPKEKPKEKISESLLPLVIPIKSLKFDPLNARLHPVNNIKAIKHSLELYGQCKPLVVRKETNVVIAGNGTLQSAIELGWKKIAVSYVDMDEATAIGYGLTDNKSAELARWDYEVVTMLDKLLQEAQQPTIGWTLDELMVLREASWTPQEVEETEFTNNGKLFFLEFSKQQGEIIEKVIAILRNRLKKAKLANSACITIVCKEWLEGQ